MRAPPTHAAGRDPGPAGGVPQAPHHGRDRPGLAGLLAAAAVVVALAAAAGATLHVTGVVGAATPEPRMPATPTATPRAADATVHGRPATEPTAASSTLPSNPPPTPPSSPRATARSTPASTPPAAGRSSEPSGEPGSGSPRRWARLVLAGWDADRAQAWRRADPAALRDLYLPASRAADRDVGLLRRWTRAGWRVRELRTEMQRLHVLSADPRRVVLRVRDRVAEVRAEHQHTGRVRRWTEQPWQTRTLRLRRADGGWKVASVT